MPAPAFAILLACKQLVDDFFIRIGGRVVDKRKVICLERGQTDHIKVESAKESALACGLLGLQILFLPSFCCKEVDRVGIGWYSSFSRRVKSPVIFGANFGFFIFRPGGARCNPAFDRFDLRRGYGFAFRRHAL